MQTRCFYKREALEMRCTKPIQVGEQLLNTYGNPPNSDLLRRYGFVDEPNRGDLGTLHISDPSRTTCDDRARGSGCQADANHWRPPRYDRS